MLITGSREAGGSLVITGYGVVLREWQQHDLEAMVQLFDEASVDFWTPLRSPFDLDAATQHLAAARGMMRNRKNLRLAITRNGRAPLGEVLLMDRGGSAAEIAYAVGLRHRGQHLAVDSVRLIMQYARSELGIQTFTLEISPDNQPSQGVARSADFS